MANRNSLAQQDLVDNLTTPSTSRPLTSNQGYVLNNEITAINDAIGYRFAETFSYVVDGTLATLPNLGELKWDTTNNQLIFNLTNSDVNEVNVINKTDNSVGGGPVTPVQDIGSFLTTTSTDYYFSNDGLVNSSLSLDLSGNNNQAIISCIFKTDLANTYKLEVTVFLNDTEGVLTGAFYTLPNLVNKEGVSFRWSLNGILNGFENQFLGSWGEDENNDQPRGVGVLVPETFRLTHYSVDLQGDTYPQDFDFTIYVNNANSNQNLTVTSGSSFVVGSLTSVFNILEGSIINIRVPIYNSSPNIVKATIILYGLLFEKV